MLGPDIRPYYFSKQATPYFNWELSKWQLQKLEYYDNLEGINNNFRKQMPDYLVDQQNVVKSLFDRMPLLQEEYQQVGGNLYRRRLIDN